MATVSSKRFKIKPLWVVGLLILSCVGLFFYQLLGPNPTIVVSKATTYITSPLDADGLPDYEAYVDQQSSEGVTSENNAAVLIWQAFWPGGLAQEHWLPLCDALGMSEIPSEEESLVEVYSQQIRQQVAVWLSEQYVMPEGMDEDHWSGRLRDFTTDRVIDEAARGPWTSEQIPPLARWVEENQRPLDLLVQATARPRYYSPSPSFLDGSNASLFASLLPEIQNMRTAVRDLRFRAMHHLGEGRPVEAWHDLRACHQLARLTAQNWSIVGQLVAVAIEGVACSKTQIFLHHAELSEPLAQQILDELLAMPQVSDMAKSMGQGERLCFLDLVLLLATGKATASSMLGVGGTAVDEILAHIQINWNVVMRIGNSWYDRVAAAAELSSRDERQQAYNRLDTDLIQLGAKIKNPGALLGGIVSRNQRSKIVANLLLSLSLPAIQAASNAQDRSVTSTAMTRVAAALAVYRAQHGEYPEQLAELVPKILPEMPLDMYSGNPFIYERKPDGGYLLYSVFQNGVDDGGTYSSGEIIQGEWVEEALDIDYGESDLVIRVPVPEFKMPSPPQAAEEEWW